MCSSIRLTLDLLLYILFVVVLAVLFDAKSTKNFGTRKKSSQAPFAHATIGEHSVGRLLATPGFRLFAGCCGPLISAAILKIIYTRANLQTCLAQWPANKRPCIGFFNGAVSLSATDYLCKSFTTLKQLISSLLQQIPPP